MKHSRILCAVLVGIGFNVLRAPDAREQGAAPPGQDLGWRSIQEKLLKRSKEMKISKVILALAISFSLGGGSAHASIELCGDVSRLPVNLVYNSFLRGVKVSQAWVEHQLKQLECPRAPARGFPAPPAAIKKEIADLKKTYEVCKTVYAAIPGSSEALDALAEKLRPLEHKYNQMFPDGTDKGCSAP